MRLYEVNSLVLSGGGIKGISILGALHYMSRETKYLNNIINYSGTSIGAIICILLCAGYTPLEIFSKLHFINELWEFDIKDVLQIHEQFGLKSNEEFVNTVMELICIKYPFINTLGELYALTNKTVYICTVNLSTEKVIYISHKTHKNMPISLALRMSCNLPGVFTKIVYDDHLYVDGGVVDNLPLTPLNEKGNTIIAIDISRSLTEYSDNINFIEYFYRVASIGGRHNQSLLTSLISAPLYLFTIQHKNYHFIKLEMSLQDRRDFFDEGYNQINETILGIELEEENIYKNNNI